MDEGVNIASVPDAAASTAVSFGAPAGVDAAAMAAKEPVAAHRGALIVVDDDDDDGSGEEEMAAAVPAAGPCTEPRICACRRLCHASAAGYVISLLTSCARRSSQRTKIRSSRVQGQKRHGMT